jgi:hypothetical protein
MSEFEISEHARQMLEERGILEAWLRRTVDSPDRVEVGTDRNYHYVKAIAEHGDRFLRVVVNPYVNPRRVVTRFFDRRLRRQRWG